MNKTLDISIETHGGLNKIKEVHLPTTGQPIRLTVIDYDCSFRDPNVVIDPKGEPTLRRVYETDHAGWPMDREVDAVMFDRFVFGLGARFGTREPTPAQLQELRHHAAAMQHIFQSAGHANVKAA